jgi:hypothetical protein
VRKVFFSLLAVALVSGSASAIPVRWTLSGVTFTDGGTASGSFVYDADLNAYSSVSITTTAGSVLLTGATLQFVAPGLTPTSGQVLTTASSTADLTGARAFALFFSTALTNAGGSVTLLTSQEASCANATCASPASPSRFTNAGSVGGAAVTFPVPALSPLALLSTALLLAAAGFAALRRGVF